MSMSEITIRRLTFGSYIKWFFFNGIVLWISTIILLTILVALGVPVYIVGVDYRISITIPNIISLVYGTLLFGVISVVFGLITYWPFRLFLKIFKSIKFVALIEDTAVEDVPEETIRHNPVN